MHRSETDVLKTCMKREERFVKRVGKRAAMNAYRVNSSDSERCTLMITESHTACHKSNECKKAETKIEKSRVKVSNSLTELFHTLKSEGVIVQTALGPDGSFRIGQWILRSQFVKSYMVQYTHNHGAQKYLDDATDLAQPHVSISNVFCLPFALYYFHHFPWAVYISNYVCTTGSQHRDIILIVRCKGKCTQRSTVFVAEPMGQRQWGLAWGVYSD